MKKMTVVMLMMTVAAGCVGCSSAGAAAWDTDYYVTNYFPDADQGGDWEANYDDMGYGGTAYDDDSWSAAHDTAPMPEEEMTADDIIGTWVYEPDSMQPSIIEIREEDGQLKYRYYRITPGNDIGINLANEYTEWEYCTGKVNMKGIAAQFDCMVGDTDRKIYTSYYYDEVNDQIADQEDGRIFCHMDDYVYDNNNF